ncbi:drug/metabolite transporter (DMT)-like permease [Donghicola tyrosinivorans]|uniref:Drug/metabolite transporter (DMT)-like permease n=2 Tax=Donghicola tyrosinivorans TaxID=1652492 RepID=A0A2T0WHJ6_9RHOB|nr:drug/metabolite transporter (DMT)-like permease [Donghicola tyrosinivorans]
MSKEHLVYEAPMTNIDTTRIAPRAQSLLWPVMAGLLVIGWSSGYVGVRYANQEASVPLLLFWRTLLSGVILLPFALLIGPRMTRRGVLSQMGFGVGAVYIYLGGFALAIEQRVPTGLVALIADLLPLAIAVMSQPVLGERLSKAQWAGTGLAVIGVLVVCSHSLSVGDAPLWAYGLTIAAMLVFAVASVLHRSRREGAMAVHQSMTIHCLTGAVLFGLTSLWIGDGLAPPMTGAFAFGMGWLVLLGTYLAYWVYYTCLRLYPAAQVSAVIYLCPPVTMLWAWALFDEPISGVMIIGLAITMVGVALTSRGKA